jgi:membrane peptidoglycan carboxypeptidase
VRQVSWLFRLLLVLAVSALSVAAITGGILPQVAAIFRAHEETAVEIPKFSSLARRSYMYDALGNEIYYYQQQNAQPTELSQVAPDAIAAILAVEDREFYNHRGVNLRALVRALLNNVQQGSSQQGASTITQQVVKLEFLSGQKIRENGGRYKLLQARYAVLMEREYTKAEILQRYLNSVYFGNNAYGIQAASEVYFGKDASQLTIVEGAFLAGMVKSPSGYDPIRRPERSRARFREVMKIMATEQLIPDAQALELASGWPLPERAQRLATRPNTDTFFTEMVRDFLLKDSKILGKTKEERENKLYRGGLKIYTTYNPILQQLAENARNSQLPANQSGVQAALASVETKTGAIRALVSGRDFKRRENEVNLALATRQTGSSIKMLILAAAIQAGAQPNDIIDGQKGCVLPTQDPKKPFVLNGGVGRPAGPLEEMTWYSINCAYARLSQIVGLNRVVDTAYRLGVKNKLNAYESFATGANEVSPLDMASAAQTIANHGVHHEPYFIERIEDADGEVIYQHTSPGVQAMDTWAADTTAQTLKGVLTKGTGRRQKVFADGRPVAGKTGTQDNNTNAWFVGFTREYATAVWVGDPRSYLTQMTVQNVPEFRKPLAVWGQDTVQGGTFPLAIWKAFMEPAHFSVPFEDWPASTLNRQAARLYLPGEECLARSSRQTQTTRPPSTATPGTATTQPPSGLKQVDSGTTIDPANLDPRAPMPSAELRTTVYTCSRGIPRPVGPPRTVPASTVPGSTPPTSKPGGPPATKPPGTTTTAAPKPTTTTAAPPPPPPPPSSGP